MSSEQQSAVLSGPASSQPSQTISADAMATVASCIPSLEACQNLAAKLNFSPVDLLKINIFDGMTAHRILNQWYAREAENATGQVLYNALRAIGLKAIANQHIGLLLGKGSSSAVVSQTHTQIAEDSSSSRSATGAAHDARPHQEQDKLQEWRSQEITDVHLQKLENTRATEEWIRIARLLQLDDQEITAIEKQHSTSDQECFRRAVVVWRDMDMEHTVGPLFDALVQAKLKGVAQRTLGNPPG